MNNVRKGTKRALSVLLAIMMVLSSVAAGLSVIASAADEWTYVPDATYEPVTVYSVVEAPENGKTYYVSVYYWDLVMTANASGTIGKMQLSYHEGDTGYYTSNDGSDVAYIPDMWIAEDSANDEFVWNNGTLYHPVSGKYVSYSGTRTISLAMGNTPVTFSYTSSSSGVMSATINGNRRYLAINNTTSRTISYQTGSTYSYILFWEKTTAYKKTTSGSEGGYYKYDGPTEYTTDVGASFNEATVLNNITVLCKTAENTPDSEIQTLTINDPKVTFEWNQAVDTSRAGTYTGTVYAEGKAVQTITVVVEAASASDSGKADPSTSNIESKFTNNASDDGRIETDKTVQYGRDEFGSFSNYDENEFSVALSALGQSYEVVKTEEVEDFEKLHPDVVFVIDASGSMRTYNVNSDGSATEITRAEATITALNAAIKELYAADPETRIGIVTFGNDYRPEGIYLPLDKYTLPEGQTDYITWGGRMVAKQGAVDATSAITALCSGSGNRYFYPTTKTASTTNTRANFRYYINTSGTVTRYAANATSGTNLGTVADGNYITDSANGYTIYRKGTTYYVYKTEDFESFNNSVKTYSDGSYAVKTKSADTTKTITENSTWPGYDGGIYKKIDYSQMTKITTAANGVTYYAYTCYTDYIAIYTDQYWWPVARMMSSPTSASYTNIYYDEYITIKANSGTSLTYSTNTYADKTGATVYFEPCEYMAATNFLINSKGEVVEPSQYQFVGGMGTYTQAGIQAAENMFAAADNKENRVPALVLISDGIPTIANTNVNNPDLKFAVPSSSSTVVGSGMTTEEGTSPDLARYGLYTIQTSVKTKQNIKNMYSAGNGGRNALYYTIGPGVGYSFGKTVLNPTAENIAEAASITTPGNSDPNAVESGVGIPRDLANAITSVYGANGTDVVDYADWSYTGDMSAVELTDAFTDIVKSLVELDRPLKETTTTSTVEDVTGAMIFTDVIGDGMELTSAPVVVYGGKNYQPTSSAVTEGENGIKITTYQYNYSVTEESTGKIYSLSGLEVKVIEDKDGKQTVKWGIPSELVPIIKHDTVEDTYTRVSPIRLVYQVKLTGEAASASGTYYTNSTSEPANVEYTPAVGNPYYYNNEPGTDGKMHSTLKDNLDKSTEKTENVTGTDPDSNDRTVDTNGKVTSELGNNGVVTVKKTELKITKVWDDGHNANGARPADIKVQLYRNGVIYGAPRTISASDSTIGTLDGDDTWTVTYTDLPYGENFVYTVSEVSVDGYETSMNQNGDNITITNSAEKTKFNYDLYLVDVDGNPIDENGNEVSFEDRTVMSALQEIEQFVGTTETIDFDEISKLVPEGYILYNPDTSYSQTFNGTGSNSNTATVVDNEAGTTKVVTPSTAVINSDGTVSGLGDFSNNHVTFAIVKIEIKPDVIVVDYGKPILCEPLKNDAGAVNLLGLGALDGDQYADTYTSQNGVFSVEGNNVVFSPFSYMSSINRVKYYANVRNSNNGVQVLSSTIYVIPATTVYYEDDFGGSAENGGLYIKYTGAWSQVADNGSTKANLSANTDINDRQDRGEVGEGHVPYGYDSSYDECIKFSNGTATVVEGTISKGADGKSKFDAYAEFTFTGTGFDIISRTDLDCGTISVAVYDLYDELVANVPVINKGVDNLYQIPVISFTGLPYGTYVVRINVNAPQRYLNITGSTFYLDAIRIYNPMALSDRDNSEFTEAYAAYYKDKESNAFIGSIRDYILAIENIGVDETSGAVYVDTINNDYVKGGVIKQESLETFHITGPNEEVYLTPGKGVGFALVCSALPSTVQLEIKIPAPHTNNASLLAQTNGKAGTQKEFVVHSAAEMFYDITDAVQFEQVQKASGTYYRAVVVLSNGIANALENDIISITNVKLTYPESVKNIIEAKDEDIIITSGVESTVIDEEGNIVETPTQVSVGMMANWNLYCDVFDTVYTQHQATIPTYDVAAEQNAYEATYGDEVTATFTTSQFVDELVITDAEGNKVDADVTSVVNEDLLYTDDFESAKTWTVTFNNVVGEYNYTVAAVDGEGETAEISVTVKPKEVASIRIHKMPANVNYTYGDEISTEGLEILVTYADGSTRVISGGYTLSTYKADKTGTRTVKVYYGDKETSFKINVKVNFVQVILTLFGLGWLWKK